MRYYRSIVLALTAIVLVIFFSISKYQQYINLSETTHQPNENRYQAAKIARSKTDPAKDYRGETKSELKRVYDSEVANGEDSKSLKLLTPQCDNIFVNMTRGKWVKKVDLEQYADQIEAIMQQEERQVKELKAFWMAEGYVSAMYSKDSRCGYERTQTGNSIVRARGSWCDAEGERPCCTNNVTGTCMPPSEEACNCPGCVDLREYKFAESSDWIVEDENCKWRNYTASQICDVIERSPFQDIYYVGDSFMRKMFKTLSIMITDDFEYGAMGTSTPPEYRTLCRGMPQYYYKSCRSILFDISQVIFKDKLCGGRGYMNFSVQTLPYQCDAFAADFMNLVKSKLGVNGSLIVLGVGAHMDYDSQSVIQQYLGPAIDVITEHYGSQTKRTNSRRLSGRWPQIIFYLPPQMGLLKPTKYILGVKGKNFNQFRKGMRLYAEQNGLAILDVPLITQLLHSFDGTHYAFGVNRLKNLILLNYIASLNVI